MNKLASINLAIKEVNKQAGLVTGLKSLASRAKSFIRPPKPPVSNVGAIGAQAAAKSTQVAPMINSATPKTGFGWKGNVAGIGASMALAGRSSPLPT